MLVELSVMEQRYQAVLAVVQDGWKVTEVAQGTRGPALSTRASAARQGSLGVSRPVASVPGAAGDLRP
jgi:hypothetical protein